MLEWLYEFFSRLHNLEELIQWGGYSVLGGIVFCETGIMLGFFLPGDSLLVTAGLFAAKGDLHIVWLNVGLSVAAISGDSLGYWIGARGGKKIYSRPDSRFFRRQHLLAAKSFYDKHGGKTIVFARFMPIVRTFAPVVAGVAEMNYSSFLTYNILGGLGWVFSMTMLGFILGKSIPNVDQYIYWVVTVVIILSLLPGFAHYWKERKQSNVELGIADEE
ncbi:MAG: VTT domain-containing protein [Acidobacteria bacterium]|nr:VTT domain-containing protein [Acidobacteriota bacterium]